MIKYNLLERKHKNHPYEYKWGKLVQSPFYGNHLCTVVDNHDEIEYGVYSGKPATLLLHLSSRVREYVHAELFSEFVYVGIRRDSDIPTYTNYPYTYEKLTNEQIITDLNDVIYNIQPLLQQTTLAGYRGGLFDDPNLVTGKYVLNDEEEYSIYYCLKDDVIIFRDSSGREIYSGHFDKERFRRAIKRYNLKWEILMCTDRLLNTGELQWKLDEYNKLKEEI